MSRAVWDEWVDSQAESVKAQGRWRRLRPLDGPGPDFRLADGTAVVSFASNDYLGLSTHPAVRAAAHDALERWGAGTGSSRLIVGDRPVHTALEDDLAAWRNSEAALVFPTGFQTNLGVLTTFGAGARIVSDELNHASIIDGARLAKAEVTVYRHGDVEHAAHLVAGAPGRALVVTDTVFSMDGDVADVEGLSEMCARANALLVLDDAHAVFGEGAAAGGATACLRVGTLSKALGSQGGYVAGPRSWIDLLINRARSFIFTTGLAPASAAAARAALDICRSTEGDARRAHAASPHRHRPPRPQHADHPGHDRRRERRVGRGRQLAAVRAAGPGHPAAHGARRHQPAAGVLVRRPLRGRCRPAGRSSREAGVRPRLVVEITGTGTEVGKTFTGAQLLRRLADEGLSVAARKPAQSYAPGDVPDSEILAQATGEPAHVVCPAHRSYPLAMAPPMAAEALGMLPATIDDLVAEINASWPDRPTDVGVVEGAGGVASPLARDGDSASLAFRLPADVVVLVADPRLGVINLVRLCRPALEPVPVVVHLNRYDQVDPLHLRNRDWLVDREGLTVTTSRQGLLERSAFDSCVRTERLLQLRPAQRIHSREEKGRPYGLTPCPPRNLTLTASTASLRRSAPGPKTDLPRAPDSWWGSTHRCAAGCCRPHPSRSIPRSRRSP